MSESSQLSGDATKMVNAWTNVQRQMWRQWFAATTGHPCRSPAGTSATSMQISEDMADCLFRAQAQWNRMYFSALRGRNGALSAFWTDWCREAEASVASCTRAQRGAAKVWLAMLWQLRPDQLTRPMGSPEEVMAAWRTAVWKTWEVQNGWMKLVSRGGEKKDKAVPEAVEPDREANDVSTVRQEVAG